MNNQRSEASNIPLKILESSKPSPVISTDNEKKDKKERFAQNYREIDEFERCIYHPTPGENIYGQSLDSGKYIPPGKRKRIEELKSSVLFDEVCMHPYGIEMYSFLIKRPRAALWRSKNDPSSYKWTIKQVGVPANLYPVVGIYLIHLFRLSDESKDTVLKSLKGTSGMTSISTVPPYLHRCVFVGITGIFQSNSTSLSCHVFKSCMLGACSSGTQVCCGIGMSDWTWTLPLTCWQCLYFSYSTRAAYDISDSDLCGGGCCPALHRRDWRRSLHGWSLDHSA